MKSYQDPNWQNNNQLEVAKLQKMETNQENIWNQKVPINGWVDVSDDTFDFGSDDDPTFTIKVSGDWSSYVSVGTRWRLADGGTQYFIQTADVSYNVGLDISTITLYGGTEYDLSGGTITDVHYSHMKAPQGFPLDPDKWTFEVENTDTESQCSPVSGTWYNVGAISANIPIGIWDLSYYAFAQLNGGSAQMHNIEVALSQADDSATEDDLISSIWFYLSPPAVQFDAEKCRPRTLTSKTTFYLNMRVINSGAAQIYFVGSNSPTFIKARCALL